MVSVFIYFYLFIDILDDPKTLKQFTLTVFYKAIIGMFLQTFAVFGIYLLRKN